MTSTAPHTRVELRLHYRDAILEAARVLIVERGGPRFSVDELAERAAVARRTVFNHFAGLDDVVLTVCADVLAVLVDDFLATVSGVPVGDGSPSAMFDELATAIRASELPRAIVTVSEIIGGADASASRRLDLSEAAFARVTGRLREEVNRRNPGADPLDASLLVSTLIHGLGVLADLWVTKTGGRLDETSLREWSALVERLLDRTRSGYTST